MLRFVAQHTGVPLEAIADYEVVYNIYDWGLNDAGAPAAPRTDPVPRAGRALRRRRHASCASCTSTRATSATAPAPGARSTARPTAGTGTTRPPCSIRRCATVAADGNIKFYGGEPTLHARRDHRRHALPARARLPRPVHHLLERREGASGCIDILDSDARSEAVLNYSIYHGRDAEPLPPHAQAAARGLGARPSESPLPGLQGPLPRRRRRRADATIATARPTSTASAPAACAASRCSPAQGRFHACPFAAEIDAPHYDLGRVGTDPAAVFAQLPGLSPLDRRRARPGGARPRHQQLRDVPPASRRVAGPGVSRQRPGVEPPRRALGTPLRPIEVTPGAGLPNQLV